ncbi:MAG: alpha-L-fucosidase [Puniceicoccaceae bacterium]
MTSRLPLLVLSCVAILQGSYANSVSSSETPSVIVSTTAEPIAPGPFEPDWQSLASYEMPEWFRDAKFGIWAHWGPQCAPEQGDWYARHLYFEDGPAWGTNVTAFHRDTYGHPSVAGFKDVIHQWTAEKWNPDELLELYVKAGARYFFAMANHHDNFDLWDSQYQPWNAVRLGPKRNIIAEWARVARSHGLKLGLSVHAAHAWSWYEPSQGADKKGALAGIPYDGNLTAEDGKGTWWDGLDPQDLYEQRHTPSPNFEDPLSIHSRWNWDNGAVLPDQAYCERFYNRTMDLINQFSPDLLYFDDTALPLWPVSDAGLKIAAHFYNQNLARNPTTDPGVLFAKILTPDQRECLTWDIERGVPTTTLPYAWQTDTCLGHWHYDRSVYEQKTYKSARTVIHMLADIVSKNGNLLLSVPIRGDGTIDEEERRILHEIASWMNVHGEAIYETRPWSVFGEGPASEGVELRDQGFNEGKGKPFTAEDVRYTMSKDGHHLYIIVLGAPRQPLSLQALGWNPSGRQIENLQLIGDELPVEWEQHAESLSIEPLEAARFNDIAMVFKVDFETN